MKLDDPIVEFVAFCEGFRAAPYQDAAGDWTIGYGFRWVDGQAVGAGTRPMGQSEAFRLLGAELQATRLRVARDLSANDADVNVQSWQMDPLASFVFNIGESAWQTSTMLSLLRSGHIDRASAEFPRWVHVHGRVEPGLVFRRYWERHMFEDGYDAVSMMEAAIAGARRPLPGRPQTDDAPAA